MSKVKDVHLHLVVDRKLFREIERWSKRQEYATNRSETVRRLIVAGLEATAPKPVVEAAAA